MRVVSWVSGLCLWAAMACVQAAPLLLQTPSVSATHIAFAYGGEVWTVPRTGGAATLLVGGAGTAMDPVFSPDGAWVAYTDIGNGNPDVFVVPTAGGTPKRLTWNPAVDEAVGWSPDGKSVLIRSNRDATNDSSQLYLLPLAGGMPQALPLSMAEQGSLSPDGKHIAYNPVFQWEPDWRDYHGGQTTRIWIARLADSSVTKIPRENSNDSDPMWIGSHVYFLSDRNGPATLFDYDTAGGEVNQLVANDGYPIDGVGAGAGAIVYTQMGELHLLDLASTKNSVVPVTIDGPLPQTVPYFKKVAKEIEHWGISATGARAVFEAHGDIFTVPAEKGDVRNLTRTENAAERDPAWSPDGKTVAYFSDASGEYALYLRDQDGLKPARRIDLGQPPSFFHSPRWSPDGKRIAYSDKRLNLWVVDLADGKPVKVDTDLFDTPLHEFDQAWSPDSRWIAYTKQLPNHLHAVFVYALDSRKATQVTDGMSDALYPQFDASGKYLYFTASTDSGLSPGWLDMTSEAHPVTRAVYVAVLRKNLPSPLAPESDEDKGVTADHAANSGDNDKKKDASKADDKSVAIDFDGLLQRTLALPVPPANFAGMTAGKTGELYLLEAPQVQTREEEAATLKRFDLKKRKTETLAGEVTAFALSADGNKMLIRTGKEDWAIAAADKPAKPSEGKIDTAAMEVHVQPRAEWAQMYDEVWRIERDFFYDPHHHGLDIAAAEAHFRPYLAGVGSRQDLNFLFRKMLAYISVGHMFVGGGSMPDLPKVAVGLLGADYTVDHDRYRFAKVYDGENWNPQLQAPLTQPGVNVHAGEYLIAVNGRNLHATDNLYGFFQQTVGKQTVLRVGPNADGSGAREVTVVPVASEKGLRHLAWVEHNRREVDRLSGGKLAYVYLPDTAQGGFTNFNRYFFAQTDRQGALIDERYNHGGQLADYIVDYLSRPPMTRVMTREGQTYTEPTQAIFGPKAMLINQFSGSGGDALPWYFKRKGIGPLIGERTWGGLVGIGGYPVLLDGGHVTAPRWALFGLNGHWEVENHGIAPDIEVWQDPAITRQGRDPQLERGVAELMQALKEHPAPVYPDPPYPNYHPVLPAAPAQN
ncbi:MAG: PD40 domain-containing protein [Proteobacteria bacterium]|nr:PD40 domain-containing protein [Pseudomonadota bacterium]